VATYGAESWTMNNYIAKQLATFERKVSRRMTGGIKVNENWRKQCNEELMQLLGDLDTLSLVRISRLKWIGHVNRMDSKRRVSKVFSNNPQGIRLPKNAVKLCTNRY
jgi:hypothetical protein